MQPLSKLVQHGLWLFLMLIIGVGVCVIFVYSAGAGTVTLIVAIAAASASYMRVNRKVSVGTEPLVDGLELIQKSLKTGNRNPLPTFSEPPLQGFQRLHTRLDDLADETSRQVSDLLSRNRNLEQDKTLFQSILGTMVEGVLVLDARGHILYFNRAARQLLDCRSPDVEGRPAWEVIRSADLQEAIEGVYASGEDFRREFEFQRSKSIVEVSATRLMLAPDPGVVIVLHDVTELRRLERLRREFVSNVSHELKTPLTSIQAYADTLLEGALDDSENRHTFVSRILEQADRLQMLIQDMLRLARIESQSEAFQEQPVDLSQILETCVDARMAVAKARNIELKLVPGDRSIEVSGDERGIATIFDNLVTNALNYTPEGGYVEVRWSLNGRYAEVEVADTGIGISAEHRERIFERFYRVDKARSRGMGGTGLGLAIVKHLTSVFKGEIVVESDVGRGSLFRVRLPVVPESVQSSQSARFEPSK